MSHSFRGGVHPAAFKTITSVKPVKRVFIPRRVVLSLSQHTGSASEPIVEAGAAVNAGDLIAKPSGRVSAALHASIGGKVTKIGYGPTHNQARAQCVTIESQGGESQDIKLKENKDALALSAEDLLAAVRDAGIVGLGGAAFPTHVKLSPPKTKPIDTVILNGAECEPYLTCDHRLMVEKPNQILKGLSVIMKILGVKRAYIAVEDNKRAASYAMSQALKPLAEAGKLDARVVVVKTKYPQGAEKQVIQALLDRVVPAGGLPMDVGCVVQNIGTAYAIYEAAYLGKPLVERVVTLTGPCVKEPMNITVRIGTLLSDLAPVFGGLVREPKKVVVGGPMMGIAQYTLDIPVSKGVSGAVFLPEESAAEEPEGACIRCGRCVDVCPVGLVPTTLMYRVKRENFAEAGDLGVSNCYECGACAYACPAKIPLLDYMKYGKARLTKQ